MNASVDKSGCIGCGLCADTCPEVFAMGDDGLAQAINAPTAETIDMAKEAAEGCPVLVITVEE